MKRLFFFFSLMLLTSLSFAQNYTRYDDIPEQESVMNVGLGIGLDYGGIGGRITFLPVKRLAAFCGGWLRSCRFWLQSWSTAPNYSRTKISARLLE